MKIHELLANTFSDYNDFEYYQKELAADYVSCPSVNDCKYDGKNGEVCTECKVKWLESEWDE